MTTGYFTANDLINMKLMSDQDNLNTTRLLDLIKTDLASPIKVEMAKGVSYYNSVHDILARKRVFFVDGEPEEDKVKANWKLPHSFHKILVDQKTAYIAGNPITITAAESEQYQEALDKFLGLKFDDVVNDWLTGASNKALEWIHFYIDEEGNCQYLIIPAEQIIPIYESTYQNNLQFVVRYYTYELVTAANQTKTLYKLELWSPETVTYYIQLEDETFTLDPEYNPNPAAHWTTWNTLTPEKREANSWGRVPFVPLFNNTQRITDLHTVKFLIDAYDLVKSDWMNDLDDFSEVIMVLKGYRGFTDETKKGISELALFIRNLKQNKAIAVEEGGDATAIKSDIPVEAKERFLTLTRKEIFYFGEGVDVDKDQLGNSPSGVSLKFLYASLDLKANRLIRKFKAAIQDFMWFATEWINKQNNTTYNFEDVKLTINKSIIFNEKEKIEELVASDGMMSLRTKLENHPLITNVDEEMKRLEEDAAKQEEKDATAIEAEAEAEVDATETDATGKDKLPS